MKIRFLSPWPILILVLSCGFAPLPLEKVANTSRTDARAADGRGGWLDLGSNDLGVLPAGEAAYAGVAFVVPPAGDETAKNCLVLGRAGAETATLELPSPVGEARLYLLHAVAGGPAPETGRAVGKVVLRYGDGSSVARSVRVGRDVSAWTSGRSFANAVRGWTEYNNNTQVSLFVSQFKLEKSKGLAAVSFAADGTCPWMVVAATVGEKVKRLVPIRSSVEPTGAYRSPAPPPELKRFPAGRKPKNVILIIGDGMGQGAAQMASLYKYGAADRAYFQQLPVVGLCSTFSADAPVTDSAAAATAFSTGTKTSNGVLGLQVDARHDRAHAVPLANVAARAHAKGLGVAVFSSDPLETATPAAFFAHAVSRGETESICGQAADCGYEFLAGKAVSEALFRPAKDGGRRRDGRDLVGEMARKGYALAHTAAEMAAAPKDAKILGFVQFDREESVGEVLRAALGRIGDRPKGFFMMAECGDTDHACHGNDPSGTIKAVSMVEFMAQAAVDFARGRGDTLVVVTADHDTGHPSVVRGTGPEGRLFIQWAETSHTKFPVPLYAYGPGAELFEGLIDNTDIAKNIVRLLDLAD